MPGNIAFQHDRVTSRSLTARQRGENQDSMTAISIVNIITLFHL